jgi:hypothetical protein
MLGYFILHPIILLKRKGLAVVIIKLFVKQFIYLKCANLS